MHSLAKVDLIKYRDENSTVFHNSISQRKNHNHIHLFIMDNKVIKDPLDIRQAFISYYSDLLCSGMEINSQLQIVTCATNYATKIQNLWKVLILPWEK